MPVKNSARGGVLGFLVTASTMMTTTGRFFLAATTASSRLPYAASFSSEAFSPRTRTQGPTIRPSLLFVNTSNGGTDIAPSSDDAKPTWTYVPFDPNRNTNTPQKRYFSTWNVPKTVDIPQDKLDIQFVRSSGAGGQNVNKVNTKVEIRLDVMSATWIPQEVRERLCQQQSNRINKDGILSLTSQEYRTQGQNKKAALDKLESMILEAWHRPKVRKQRTGISEAAKERNKEFKKKRSEVKKNRKGVDW